jgi:chromosome segregation ATPase
MAALRLLLVLCPFFIGLVQAASLRSTSNNLDSDADADESSDSDSSSDSVSEKTTETQHVQNQNQAGMPAEAIKRVIDMLNNLIAEMDAEAEQDEKQFAEFQKWCTTQQAASAQYITQLQTTIEELKAALALLYSQRSELEAVIARLNGEIDETKSQIAQATEKRNEEHANFVTEQQDFENSINACNKAVDILKKHYGDGDSGPPEKPGFMSFAQLSKTIQETAARTQVSLNPEFVSFLQQPGSAMSNRYESKAGEAGSIVDQMKMLAETFTEDKQSAADEEARLTTMYQTLMQEKTAVLNSLTKERDERQQVLNTVNQDIGEKESAKANAEQELKDEQAYLAQTKKLCTDTAMLFEQRKKDRAEEKMATQEAIKVLEGDAGEAFLQRGSRGVSLMQRGTHRHRAHHRGRHKHHGKSNSRCPSCRKAASLLSQAATTLRSGMLATAAAATMGTDAVMDVIDALNGLIRRLDEDQQMEKEHKEWCENEMSTTSQKKTHHEGVVEELTQKINDEGEVIVEKEQGIKDTQAAIVKTDKNYEEATQIRKQAKQDFEVEQQNYKDALDALNQAIDILAKFYAKKKSFVQVQQSDDDSQAPREMQPGVFDSVYEQKGGKGVVQMISMVRKEYEQGKADLEAAEAQAVIDYTKYKADYQAMRRDLVSQEDRLNVELQTAKAALAQYKEDKAANEQEIQAAITYLGQLAQSCDSLLQHYDERVKLRKQEKAAIKEAINVLQNET